MTGVLEYVNIVFWNNLTDLIILVIVIIFAILFFVAQYYLIKGYIFLVKSLFNIPFVKQYIEKLEDHLNMKIKGYDNFKSNFLKKSDSDQQ